MDGMSMPRSAIELAEHSGKQQTLPRLRRAAAACKYAGTLPARCFFRREEQEKPDFTGRNGL